MQDRFQTLSKILEERYSCRGYLDKEVDQSVIEDVTHAASRVPTWCNAQPWKVIVTRGNATKEFANVLTHAASNSEMKPDFDWPKQYTGVYRERRRTCGYQLYESLEIDRDDRERRAAQMMENFRFFGAPHVAIVTTDADLGPYGSMDVGGFIAMFAVAAKAKGVSSVVQASVTGYAPTIRKYFGIPQDRLIQTAISFGYEDCEHAANQFRTGRARVGEVVTVID